MKHCLMIALLVSAIGAVTCQNRDDINCVTELVFANDNMDMLLSVCPELQLLDFNVSSLTLVNVMQTCASLRSSH